MRPRILLVTSTGIPLARVDELRASLPGVDIVTTPDDLDAIRACVPGAHALIGCPRVAFSAELLEAAGPTLRWIHVPGAGCEEFLISELVASDITLTAGRILQGPSVADHALALLLALTRNLAYALRGTVNSPRPIELRGKAALVVGLGGIGLLVAERLRAFGMRVAGVDPEVIPMLQAIDRVDPPERLHDALARADIVIVTAPLTPLTHRRFDASAFAAMSPHAIFVNVARGRIVDTDALIDALRHGRLRAAGLDVTDPEPLPDDHPLRSMPNAIITPHVAGPSDQNRERSIALIMRNIERYAQGLPLLNIIDKMRGY